MPPFEIMSKLIAPDLERLARTPWPKASRASSGTRSFSSDFAASCSAWALWVREKIAATRSKCWRRLYQRR